MFIIDWQWDLTWLKPIWWNGSPCANKHISLMSYYNKTWGASPSNHMIITFGTSSFIRKHIELLCIHCFHTFDIINLFFTHNCAYFNNCLYLLSLNKLLASTEYLIIVLVLYIDIRPYAPLPIVLGITMLLVKVAIYCLPFFSFVL